MRRGVVVFLLCVLGSGCGSAVLDLEVGQCFDDPPDFGAVEEVPIVDCISPHGNEVIAVFDISGDTYPGDDAVGALASDGCEARFAGYVGEPYEDSVYVVGWLTPTEESWAVGDREVICFVLDPAGMTTGSVRGTAA